jgi:hypothetical protein
MIRIDLWSAVRAVAAELMISPRRLSYWEIAAIAATTVSKAERVPLESRIE